MGRIFVTSDTHFGHDREFVWKVRGFNSVEEMNAAIIERWNSVVTPEDEVYHLGDVMLGDNDIGVKCLEQLNGKIWILTGNHDTNNRIQRYVNISPNILHLGYATVLKYKKLHFYLSHYPTMTSNLEKGNHLYEHMLNLYGHTHQMTNFYNGIPFMYHCGQDSHNCTPVLLDDIIEDIKTEAAKCVKFTEGENENE